MKGKKAKAKNRNVDEKEGIMDILVRNVKYVKEKNNIKTNKELAKELKVAESTLTKVLAKDQMPSIYPFLHNLARVSGWPLDDLIYTDLEESARYDNEDYGDTGHELEKSMGLYQLFYFSTSALAGREVKKDMDALDYGLLLVYRTSDMEFRCAALFGMKEMDMRELYSRCMEENSTGRKFYSRKAYQYLLDMQGSRLYEGVVDTSRSHLHFALNREGADWVTMLTHWPTRIGKEYIGGLGMVSSLSKGRDTDPCMQYIGISRYALNASAEEISQLLYSRYPFIMPKNEEINTVLHEIKKLDAEPVANETESMEGDHMDLNLAKRSKYILLQGLINKLIMDVVERNTHRVIRISGYNDDDWYHLVKQYKENEHA